MPQQDELSGGNLRSLIASTIVDKARELGQQPPAQQPAQQPVQPPVQPPVQQVEQPPVQQVEQPPVQQPAPVVVSTESVEQLDIGAMFKTPTTEAPAAPPPLPPDTPVQAPPEIEQNEKAKSAWEILRNRERESRHRAEALQAQLENVTKQAGTVAEERARFAAELQGRDDRIHELEEKLGKADLASSPEFRRQYDEKMDAASASFADALRDAADIDEAALPDTVKKLLATSDADFTRMVSKLPATAQGSLWDKRREYRGIASARESAISEWRTAQAGVAKTDEQRQIVENAERRRSLAEQAIDFTNTKIDPRHRPTVLSEDTYRADVESANQQFRGFMQVATDDEIARVAYQGFLVPVMQRQIAYLADAIDKYRDAYFALRGAGAPPALPIRVQTEQRAAPAAPLAPQVVDRGGGFSGVVQDTLANTIRQVARR